MNEFEQKLSRQPLREIPGEWRTEILSAAQSAVSAPKQSKDNSTSNLILWLRELLWPHPRAWAGLAAIWLFIFAVNFSIRDKTPAVAGKISTPTPEVVAELRQQQKMFVELLGVNETRVAERQKIFLPKPQSEYEEFLTA